MRKLEAAVILGALALAGCSNGGTPTGAPTPTTETVPLTPSTAPPTTTTAPPPVYPPTNLSQAKALAATGDTDGFSQFNYRSNDDASCPNMGYFVTVPPSLMGQPLAAALLAFYFQTAKNHPNSQGCGGLNIDAYYSQSQASPNSATAGGATAGNVQLMISSKANYQVFVTVGSVTDSTVQFNFSY